MALELAAGKKILHPTLVVPQLVLKSLKLGCRGAVHDWIAEFSGKLDLNRSAHIVDDRRQHVGGHIIVKSFRTMFAAPLTQVLDHLLATLRTTQVHYLVIVENRAHKTTYPVELRLRWRQILALTDQLITQLEVVTLLSTRLLGIIAPTTCTDPYTSCHRL